MALIDDLLRSASVVARAETRVLSLDRWNLHKEIETYPSLAIELLQVLSKRLRALEKTMIRTLGGFIPICANCKRIRDDNGSWVSIEEYISDRSGVEFTHGICPECSEKLYPGYG
jgi:CRP-like cAMP-binding protein